MLWSSALDSYYYPKNYATIVLHKFDISLLDLLSFLTDKIVNIPSGFFVPIMLLK